MQDARKHSRFVASLAAVITFILSIVLVEAMILMSHACWRYGHGIVETGEEFLPFGPFLHGFCAGFALVCGVFTFRVCRRSVSPAVVFHAAFGAGLGLLCFCLWLVLISFSLDESPFASDWSTHSLLPLFSAPLTCLLLMPAAVLLLAYATARDYNGKS